MTIVLFILITLQLLSSVQCVDFFINRTLKCVVFNNNVCTAWTSIGKITRPSPKCFPAHTLVLTKNGPKTMSQLQVGDEVFAYDEQSNSNKYTRVQAWLHRITDKKFEYLKILTDSVTFHSSSKHNIAVKDSETLRYVFGRDLLNHTLVSSNPNEHITVTGLEDDVSLGVYSPYTALGNYYIIGQNRHIPLRKAENTLLLVHSFAEIVNPTAYNTAFGLAMWTSHLLGFGKQPTDKQYVHPLSHLFIRMFPELVSNGDMVHQSDNFLVDLFNYRYQNNQRQNFRFMRVMTMVDMILQGPSTLFI